MPRARTTIRKRFTDGVTDVLEWTLEETLVFGSVRALDPTFNRLHHQREWQHEWNRWRDVILPKVIATRPGTRPFAMYAAGEIPPRPVLRQPLARWHFTRAIVTQPDGSHVTHYLDAPASHVMPEVDHLVALGLVDDAELRRHREWLREANPECSRCPVDHYHLEMALHD